jgi:hypothetical protein
MRVLDEYGKVLGSILVPDSGDEEVELEVAPESLVQIVGKDEQFVKAEFITFQIGLAKYPDTEIAFHAAYAGDLSIEVLRRVKTFEEQK